MRNIPSVEEMTKLYGVWGQHPHFPSSDWLNAVANKDTRRGYWDWVRSMLVLEADRKDCDE